MILIQSIDDMKKHASEWKPDTCVVNSVEEASDHINFPHEDYPKQVKPTIKALEYTIDTLKERHIGESDIKFIHKICMEGKDYLQLGKWRIGEVTVNGTLIPPQPYLIAPYIMSIMPVGLEFQKDIDSIFTWFKEFETIHPFEDGNGRVGNTILAAMSYLLTGEFLVPKKY